MSLAAVVMACMGVRSVSCASACASVAQQRQMPTGTVRRAAAWSSCALASGVKPRAQLRVLLAEAVQGRRHKVTTARGET